MIYAFLLNMCYDKRTSRRQQDAGSLRPARLRLVMPHGPAAHRGGRQSGAGQSGQQRDVGYAWQCVSASQELPLTADGSVGLRASG